MVGEGDLTTLNKMRKMGATLIEVQAERKRQAANAPSGPTALANMLATHAAKADTEALEAKMWAAAAVRPASALRLRLHTTLACARGEVAGLRLLGDQRRR